MRFRSLAPLAPIAAASLCLAGCGGSGLTATPATNGGAVPLQSAVTFATQPVDTIFGSDASAGIVQLSLKGKVIRTFGSVSGLSVYIGMDDAGNVYDESLQSNALLFTRYKIGGGGPVATYTPTSTTPTFVFAAPTGEIVVSGSSANGEVYDIWDAGSPGGAPSRSLVRTSATGELAVAADGTLYIAYQNTQNGKLQYDVVPPQSPSPSRTIVDTIVPAYANFAQNFMSVASDGTLYVGEWTYTTGDPLAGLYVYPASGAEHVVTKGAPSPTGIDLDSAGNVYVANSSSTFVSGGYTADTTHLLSIYSPHAKTLLREVKSGFENPQNLTVAANGTAYMVDFSDTNNATGSLVQVVPKGTAAALLYTPFNGSNVVLYDGRTVKGSAVTRIGGGGPVARFTP